MVFFLEQMPPAMGVVWINAGRGVTKYRVKYHEKIMLMGR